MGCKIGEAARLANLTTRTIRYYEELGLLGLRPNRVQGQLRSFDSEHIERLKRIQTLKGLGLSLEEVGQVIELYFTDGQLLEGKRRVVTILKRHIATADEKIRELSLFKRECEASIAKLEAIIEGSAVSEKNALE